MKFVEKYIELRSIVKKWGLKKIKTKNILAGWGKLKCQEKVLQNFRGLTTISSYYWKPLKTWMLKKITRFYPRPTVIYVLVFLPSVVSFCKKLLFLYQTLLNLKKSKSYPIIVSDVFPLGLWSRPIALGCISYHFQNRSVPTPLRYENHAEKNMFQWKQKAYPILKLERRHSDPVWWKHSISNVWQRNGSFL